MAVEVVWMGGAKGARKGSRGPLDIWIAREGGMEVTLAVEGRLGLRFGGGLEAMGVALGGCLVVDEV